MEFRLSSLADHATIMALINEAKAHLKKLGIDQWQNEYPDEECIKTDILSGHGYLLTEADNIIGYACISFNKEECYQEIQGNWLSTGPYAVIHRMTIANKYKGKGLSAKFLEFAQSLSISNKITSIKIDTDPNNEVMKHLLLKNGYQYCGIINFDNSEKIAFEKIL